MPTFNELLASSWYANYQSPVRSSSARLSGRYTPIIKDVNEFSTVYMVLTYQGYNYYSRLKSNSVLKDKDLFPVLRFNIQEMNYQMTETSTPSGTRIYKTQNLYLVADPENELQTTLAKMEDGIYVRGKRFPIDKRFNFFYKKKEAIQEGANLLMEIKPKLFEQFKETYLEYLI